MSMEYKILSRLQTLLEELKLSIDQLKSVLESLTIEAVPVTVQFPVRNRVRKFTVDLTTPHTDMPLGISKEIGRTVTHAVVTKRGDIAYWKRNDPSSPLEELWVGYSIDDFEISELYISNPASSIIGATLEVLVEWRE